MPFSVVHPVTKKVNDVVCKKWTADKGWYNVFLGDEFIGQVTYSSYEGWQAISNAPPRVLRGFRSARGFKRRRFALEYILRANGIWPDLSPVCDAEIPPSIFPEKEN